ncbi:hypothetical protein ACE02Z_05980 [Shewanella xiamenensis]
MAQSVVESYYSVTFPMQPDLTGAWCSYLTARTGGVVRLTGHARRA